jgi:hypothetical protein
VVCLIARDTEKSKSRNPDLKAKVSKTLGAKSRMIHRAAFDISTLEVAHKQGTGGRLLLRGKFKSKWPFGQAKCMLPMLACIRRSWMNDG